MTYSLRDKLRIPADRLDAINGYLLREDNSLVKGLLEVVARHGTPEEINAKAREAGKLETLMGRLRKVGSPYVKDLEWLIEQRDTKAFVRKADYVAAALGDRAGKVSFDEAFAVTLEVSALQYFPWLLVEARQAIEKRELMPGRFIRVRNMAEQVGDNDVLAVAAAMQIVGASWVETLDTKGTDGSNVHLGGPATITGYFGGVGQPNDHVLKWVDELLGYYTGYGVRQVLNVNAGSILAAMLLHRLGVDIEFKISVYVGIDNPFSVLSTLTLAKLFARDDGTTPVIGFNFANSVDNETIELGAEVRKAYGFEDVVRFEHHIYETWKSIVVQPYDRRAELVEVAKKVKNISAKHEGGEPAVELTREHPSDILDYFRAKKEVVETGDMAAMERNFLDKHDSVNGTARALLAAGIPVIAARNLH